MKFFELQKLLKEKQGVIRLADIARELGVSPQAVSNWKSRDKVPYKYVIQLRETLGYLNSNNDKNTSDIENYVISDTAGNNTYVENYHEESASLIDVINIIQKYFKMIVIITSMSCLVTLITVFMVDPEFTAYSTLKPSTEQSSSSGGLRAMASQFGISVPGGSSSSNTDIYPQIIQSRTISRRLLNRKFDTDIYGQNQTLFTILNKGKEKPDQNSDKLEKLLVEKIRRMIDVKEDKMTGILTISASAIEAKLAADLVSAIVDELESHQKEFLTLRLSAKKAFIENRFIEVGNELKKSEEILKVFREKNRQIGTSPALLLEEERLNRDVDVQSGLFITLKNEHELAKIEEVESTIILNILDPPEAPVERSYPKRKLSLMIAFILGVALSVGIALIKEWYKYESNTNSI